MRIHELYQQTQEGLYDPDIFKAVLMAGSPGSGKSTVARKLFTGTGLKELNVDKFWDLYHKMGKEKEYSRFYHLTSMQKSNWLEGRLGLLVDGTARDLTAMKEIKAELEGLGYDTAMIFVNTDLDTAMKRVVKRQEETGREVTPDFVKASWHAVQQNLGSLQQMFGGNFFIVNNSKGSPDLRYVQKKMSNWLRKPPRMPAAIAWINQQSSVKK